MSLLSNDGDTCPYRRAESGSPPPDASHEIARFDAELSTQIAPFGTVLLHSESAASSHIENLTASARAIAEAELSTGSARSNARAIVANAVAMRAALALSDRLDAHAILQMHAALIADEERHSPGRWRGEQVWIGGGNTPLNADFVPPEAGRVPAAIEDMLGFARRDDVPLLAQIAITHAQFETIHPFTDGNGRTGRALVQSMMRNKRLTRQITVPVSAGLLADTGAYFDALDAYRAGDAAAIVDRFADAALRAVANGRWLVGRLREIRSSWDD